MQQTMTSEELLEPEGKFPDVEFTGSRRPLFRLILKNSLLTIFTVGIYRFWAKTWVRQYYWGNVRVYGDPLEYTGRPIELLVGFLIVLAILLPMGGIYSGLELMAEGAPSTIHETLNASYYVVLYMLVQVAFYRMWRFRLTRTTWRGIRFGMDGSAWTYLGLSIMWGLVTVATIGIAFPWMRAKLIEYRMNQSRFGNTAFSFHMPVQDLWGLFVPWLVTYLVYFGALIYLAFFYWSDLQVIWELGMGSGNPEDLTADMARGYLAFFILFLLFPVFLVWYRTRELQFSINGIRIENQRFHSEIRPPFILWRIVLTLFSCGIVIIAVSIAFSVIMALGINFDGVLADDPKKMIKQLIPLFVVYSIGLAFLFLVAIPILTHLLFRFPAVKHICETLYAPDQSVFEEIIQSTQDDPSYGEGLADAFDVGAI